MIKIGLLPHLLFISNTYTFFIFKLLPFESKILSPATIFLISIGPSDVSTNVFSLYPDTFFLLRLISKFSNLLSGKGNH